MELKELRIGNYVLSQEDEPYFFKVEAIKDKYGKLGVVYRNGSCWDSEPEPIELTEEILLKSGFKYTPCGIQCADMWQGLAYWDYKELHLRGCKNIKYPLKIQGFINSEIKYLHQLQNLYFALTGKELEIQL